jgi:hypothetical protein
VKDKRERIYYRIQIATAVLNGLLAGSEHEDTGGHAFEHQPAYIETMAIESVRFADALLAALEES